jgi:hypothetical protein
MPVIPTILEEETGELRFEAIPDKKLVGTHNSTNNPGLVGHTVITATQEAKVGGSWSKASPGS